MAPSPTPCARLFSFGRFLDDVFLSFSPPDAFSEWNAVAMGKSQRLPRFVDDESDLVVSARIMPISWGGDHRAVDGATMARFGNLWKSYCENPSSMMFAMR